MGGCFTWEQIAHSSIPLVKLEKKFNGLYGNFITLFVVAVAFWAVPVVVSSPLLSFRRHRCCRQLGDRFSRLVLGFPIERRGVRLERDRERRAEYSYETNKFLPSPTDPPPPTKDGTKKN